LLPQEKYSPHSTKDSAQRRRAFTFLSSRQLRGTEGQTILDLHAFNMQEAPSFSTADRRLPHCQHTISQPRGGAQALLWNAGMAMHAAKNSCKNGLCGRNPAGAFLGVCLT
jgi:hypothetical protein